MVLEANVCLVLFEAGGSLCLLHLHNQCDRGSFSPLFGFFLRYIF